MTRADIARADSRPFYEQRIAQAVTGRDFVNQVSLTVNALGPVSRLKVQPADRSRARLLKFCCDRARQRNIFVDTLEKALVTPLSWPQVVVAIGRDTDCVDTFVERLCTEELPAFLHRAQLGRALDVKSLVWPREDIDSIAGVDVGFEVGELQKAVAESLGLSRNSAIERIARALSAQRRAVVFVFDINGERFDIARRQVVHGALQWWASLASEISTTYPIIVIPWVTFRPRRLLCRDRFGAVFSQLKDISGAFSSRLTVLPPLGMVTHQDAIDWLNEYKHHALEQPADYAVKLAAFFSGWLGSSRSVTMTEASGFFGKLVAQMGVEIAEPNLVEKEFQP